MFDIAIHTDPRSLVNLSPEWEQLVKGKESELFSGPRWYEAHRQVESIQKLGIVTARLGGELVGVLPLCLLRSDWKGLFFSVITTIARGDHQAIAIREDLLPALLPQMLDRALAHFRGAGTFWWPFLPEDDPGLEVLRDYFRRRGSKTFEECEVSPRLRLQAGSFEELEKQWSKNHRIDVRRQRKRLAELGSLALWSPCTLEEANRVLDEFFDVHDEKWLAQGSPGRFRGENRRRQFREILKHLWGHEMHFTTVRLEDKHISYHFGFQSGGWIQWYRPSYRSEFHGYSPGKVHIALLLEDALRKGWAGFDFLNGNEPYKSLWANESRSIYSLWAETKPGAYSFRWFAEGKPYFRKKGAGYLSRTMVLLQKLKAGLKRRS